MFGQWFACQLCRRHYSRQSHGSRALDVIIEGTGFVLPLFEQTKGIEIAKIFELNQNLLSKLVLRCLKELSDERIIGRATFSVSFETQIVRILQEALVVGAHIQVDWKNVLGMDSGAGLF